METPALLVHLHKLSPTTPEESLAGVVETLWKTKSSGLSSVQRSHVESLLNLPAPIELDPILASLRLIIRKVSKEKLTGEELQKLLPVDLPVEVQKTIVAVMQNYHKCLEEEAAGDQPLSHTGLTFPYTNALPAYTSLLDYDLSSWTRESVKSIPYDGKSGCSISNFTALNPLQSTSVPSLKDNASSYNPSNLPRLKSMTWILEKRNSVSGNHLSVITLKLQDFTKSHSGEVEVKFQLSRDHLEAMLRSMSYINDQMSDSLHTNQDHISCYFNPHLLAYKQMLQEP